MKGSDFMKSILEEFAQGNISTGELPYNPDSHYGRIMGVLVECEYRLDSILNEDGKEIFEEYNKSQMEMEALIGINKFISGYRLGVLMTTEVFNGKNDFIASDTDF